MFGDVLVPTLRLPFLVNLSSLAFHIGEVLILKWNDVLPGIFVKILLDRL